MTKNPQAVLDVLAYYTKTGEGDDEEEEDQSDAGRSRSGSINNLATQRNDGPMIPPRTDKSVQPPNRTVSRPTSAKAVNNGPNTGQMIVSRFMLDFMHSDELAAQASDSPQADCTSNQTSVCWTSHYIK